MRHLLQNTCLHLGISQASTSGDMDGLASGHTIYFGYDNGAAATDDSCCLEYFANEGCTESPGKFKTFCGPGTHVLEFFTAIWLVKGCKLTYSK